MSIVRDRFGRAGGMSHKPDRLVGMSGSKMRVLADAILAVALALCSGQAQAQMPEPAGLPMCNVATDTSIQGGTFGQCKAYAACAVKQAQFYVDYECGGDYNSPRWSPNPKGHFDWCFGGARQSEMSGEEANRNAAVSRCQICRHYSNLALAAAADNAQFHCGNDPNDPMWSSDPNAHFAWCMGLTDVQGGGCDPWPECGLTWSVLQTQELDPRTNARNDAIEKCKTLGKSQGPLTVEQPCAQGETRLPSGACCAKTNVSACGECCPTGKAPNAATGTCLFAVTQPPSQAPQTPSPEVPR